MRWMIVVMGALVLGACGDDDDSSGGAGTSGGQAGTSSGVSCATAAKTMCKKACDCGTCGIRIGTTVINATSQAECETNITGACDTKKDYTQCNTDVSAATCQDAAPIGQVIDLPSSCQSTGDDTK